MHGSQKRSLFILLYELVKTPIIGRLCEMKCVLSVHVEFQHIALWWPQIYIHIYEIDAINYFKLSQKRFGINHHN